MSVSNNSKHKCLLLTQESINFSPSKMSHSFAKDKRFNSISGHKYEKSEFTHTMKSTFGRRSPSFGVGDRFKVRRNGKSSSLASAISPNISSHIEVGIIISCLVNSISDFCKLL